MDETPTRGRQKVRAREGPLPPLPPVATPPSRTYDNWYSDETMIFHGQCLMQLFALYVGSPRFGWFTGPDFAGEAVLVVAGIPCDGAIILGDGDAVAVQVQRIAVPNAAGGAGIAFVYRRLALS